MHRDSNETGATTGRILFVANTDWYLYNFRLNLLKESAKHGWQVVFASPPGDYVRTLQNEGFEGHTVQLDSKGLNPWREFKALLQLAAVFRTTQPDTVHLFTLKCVLYGCLVAPFARGAHIVGAITGMGHLFTTRSWRTRLLKTPVLLAMKAALKLSGAHLVFQNESDRDEFIEHRLIPRARTSVIRGSGVDCSHFCPKERSASERPLSLLFCGRLLKEKGITEYLAATDRLRELGAVFTSTIAGAPYPGNPSSLNEDQVDALRKNADHNYLGHSEDMKTLFSEADIVVLPTYREGTPKALLEAAASGCIIVTTDIPGCQGIVDPHLNGHLVPTREVEPLVAALQDLISSTPQQRASMREHSRTIALERFSDGEVNRRTVALYASKSA